MEFSLDRFYQLNRRILIWIALFGLLWLLRDYFALIFLTFVLAFAAVSLSHLAQRYLHMRRSVSVIVVYVLYVAALGLFVQFVTPAVIRETGTLTKALPDIQDRVLEIKGRFTQKYPSLNPILRGYVKRMLGEDDAVKTSTDDEFTTTAPRIAAAAPRTLAADAAATSATAETLAAEEAERARAARVAEAREDERLSRAFVTFLVSQAQRQVPHLIGLLWNTVGTLLLALLFSFLITLDITRLRGEIQNLRASRLHDFYEQTALPVVRFCYVLGRAFQAQAVIACINTFLTFIGLLILSVPSVAMLSVIVFLCSFVPVLGVFISTVPIVLVALNAGGLSAAVQVIVLVAVVHAVEAYLLNPLVYGAHLKINPVLVLIILYVGHRAFGVWGMLLAVPVAHYLLHDVFGVPVWKDEANQAPPPPPPAVAGPPNGGNPTP